MDPLRSLSAAERFARARELRHNPTPAERHAWTLLRNRGILGLKFRRQHVLHGFIVDFYCPSERIVIELEGGVHDNERNEATTRRERLGPDRQFPLSRRERGSGGEDSRREG